MNKNSEIDFKKCFCNKKPDFRINLLINLCYLGSISSLSTNVFKLNFMDFLGLLHVYYNISGFLCYF